MTSRKNIYYSDYLSLDSLLNSQHLESEKNKQLAHDEMLFIITHQTFELWFKQILFEMDSILERFSQSHLQDEDMYIVVSRLKRIVQIQKLLIRQFDVLETMSPMDFLSFRDFLIPASGFQSLQFKVIEKKFGVTLEKNHANYSLSVLSEQDRQKADQNTPTLLSGIVKWLERNPFVKSGNYSFADEYKKAVNQFLDRETALLKNETLIDKDKTAIELKKIESFRISIESLFDEQKYKTEMSEGKKKLSRKAFISALFIRLYSHFAILQMPSQILDLIVDVNEHHVMWKRRHLAMIQRMIGIKMGTGGTSGKDFLEHTIRQSYVFSDLIEMPSYMIAKKNVPQLPREIEQKLGYVFQ